MIQSIGAYVRVPSSDIQKTFVGISATANVVMLAASILNKQTFESGALLVFGITHIIAWQGLENY